MLLSDNQLLNSDIKHKYTLSVRVYPDGFYFFVVDRSNTIITSENVFAPKLESLSANEIINLLNDKIKIPSQVDNLKIVYESNRYSFVPEHFTEKIDHDLLLSFSETKSAQKIIDIAFPFWKNRLLYSIPQNIYEAFTELFPSVRIEHSFEFLLDEKSALTSNIVYLWLNKKTIDLLVVKSGKAVLANNFEYVTNEDIVYHVLHIYELLELDIEKFSLKTLSLLPEKKALVSLLKKFIPHCG